MPSSRGTVILAAAGSGKTTWISRCVAEHPEEHALITTFTILNSERVQERLHGEMGRIPTHTRVRTWFTFLLEDLVRPYQNLAGREERVTGLHLAEGRSAIRIPKSRTAYWFDRDGRIYSDKISEFALLCETKTGGRVLGRLGRLYQHIYIDEVQDLAGYDLDLVERMLRAGLSVTMVGDPRQGTFSTNQSAKNSRFRRAGIADLFRIWENRGLCEVTEHSHSHRCAPEICRLADALFAGYAPIESRNDTRTGHEGVFAVSSQDRPTYISRFHPKLLRYDSRSDAMGLESINFGASKGLQFERVLIVPTGPIRKWLASGDPAPIEASLPKLYVAVTRAFQSVAFLYDGPLGMKDLVKPWAP